MKTTLFTHSCRAAAEQDRHAGHVDDRGHMFPVAAESASRSGNSPGHRGVTLTEVLMSLMIMSIGVTSVLVLFPISTLRSIQANQLTHGAINKYNVEALLQSDPRWIVDPDRDGNLIEHFQLPASRNYVVDPLGFYTHWADGNGGFASVFGNDGTSAYGTLQRFGGGLTTVQGIGVDSAGVTTADLEALKLLALSTVNQGDGWITDIDATPVGLINSPNGIIGVQLPPPSELDLSAVGTSRMMLPGTAPLDFLIPDPELYRVVLYSEDNLHVQAYPLTHITPANAVTWSEDTDGDGTGDHDFNMSGTLNAPEDIRPLPAEFENQVSRVLLQSRRMNDFSWFLTVRRRSDGFVRSVDIVVRFTNGVDLKDERLYEATFVKGTNVIGLRYPADGTTPPLKRGKFIFDAQNARWYRIQDFRERPASGINIGWPYPAYDAVVYSETEISEPGGEDQFSQWDSSGNVSLLLNGQLDSGQYDRLGTVVDPKKSNTSPPPFFLPVPEDLAYPGNGNGTLDFGLAIIPSGIVDVYPMGSMKMPTGL